MNLRDFEYIVALGQYRSITKAAQELYISQPALSKFLTRMEQEAGTKLFQHTGKNLVPTLAGEFCIEKAVEILHINEQINNRINDIAKLNSGRIRIGLPMSRTEHFLSQVLPRFYKMYPGIHIVIFENATAILQQKVRNGELDLIFINILENNCQPYLHYETILEEEMVLAAPDTYHLEDTAYILEGHLYPCLSPFAWKDLPYIMLSSDQATRTFSNQYFSRNGITPHVALEIRNLAQAINAVRYGIGVTITPSIQAGSQSGISYYSLPSKEGTFRRKAAVVYRTDTYLSHAERELIQIIKKSVEPPLS